MKLPVAARDALRSALKSHADIGRHTSHRTEVDKLEKRRLLALAKKLGMDVPAIVKEASQNASGLESFMEAEEIELMRYSTKHPAFSGISEFDLALEVFGIKFIRRARIVWEFTPPWEYYDLNKGRVMKGWPGWGMQLEILAAPDSEQWEATPSGRLRRVKNTAAWMVANQLLEGGVFPSRVHEEIDSLMEAAAQTEDARRRSTYSG